MTRADVEYPSDGLSCAAWLYHPDRDGPLPLVVMAHGFSGSLAVTATPDSKPGFEAILPPETRWENRVAARIALRVGTYRPGRRAPFISSPVLACVCDADSLTSADRTVELVSKAPRAEIKRYPIGHFDIYVGEWWERAVADQTDFLSRHLLKREPSLTH